MSGSLLAALSGARVGSLHRRVLLTISVMFFFDLADLNTFAFAAPAIRRAHDFTVHDVAWVTGVGFAGMAIGAIAGGRLTDVIGRRTGMLCSVLLFSTGSLLNTLISSVELMSAARFVTGLGLGAMTTVAITYLSEVTPADKRGRFQSIALGTGLVGIPVVAFMARAVTGEHPESWRLLFLFGSLGFLLIPLLLRLPESPRWLLSRGRDEEAAAIVRRFAPDFTGELETAGGATPESATAPKTRMADLFAPGLRRTTVVMMVVWLFVLVGFYGFQSWVPTLLADRGQDFAHSLTMSAVTTIGAVPGAFLAWPFIDRVSRKNMAVVLGLVVTALGIGYGLSDSPAMIMLFGLLVAALSQTYIAVLYSYTPEVFPTHLRTAGAGLGNGLGRVGNVIAPLIIASIYTAPALGYVAVFGFISACWLIATITLALFGPETKSSSLEQLHVAQRTERNSNAPS